MKRSFPRKRPEATRVQPTEYSTWLSLRTNRRGDLVDRWPIYALAALSWVLSLPLFEPWSYWPLGYVVFVPFLVAQCAARRSRHVHIASLLLGSAFFLTHFRWLYTTTPAGYAAGSVYLAVYFLPAMVLVRHLVRRRGMPASIAFAVVWTAVELLRSRGPLGFPWFLLGHSQVHRTTMIQVADLAGVYGVSFVLAAVNGWLTDFLLAWPALRSGKGGAPRSARGGVLPVRVWRCGGAVLVLLAATFGYGRYRLATQAFVEGPRVAVLQGDYTLVADRDVEGASDAEKHRTYQALLAEAARASPDLFVLPETPWTMYLNAATRVVYDVCQGYHREFLQQVAESGVPLVVGAMAEEPNPAGSDPPRHRYNSAYVYAPGEPEPRRYDKIHLVPFGEYVPFRHRRGLRWLYRWLNDSDFNPWGRGGVDYSLTSGRECSTFTLRTRGAEPRALRYGVTICYEDVIPQLFRRFVGEGQSGKRVDFMLNISNDGWFGRGTQQPQHLASCVFRAVENRVPIARAVNTGVSGFIRPDGVWHDLVSESPERPRAGGIGTKTAALSLDERVSGYSLYGDAFGAVCGLLAAGALADAVVRRWRRGRTRRPAGGGQGVKGKRR